MDRKRKYVCDLMDFVDRSCHWICKPPDVTTDINIEFKFHKDKKVLHFPHPFTGIMFSLSKESPSNEVNIFCFSEAGQHDICVEEVRFFRFSSFGRKVNGFFKKYDKLYKEQEWVESEVSLREFLSGNTFCPNWVSKPGETIVDFLEEKKKTVRELSKHLNRSEAFVNGIIEANIYISPLIAIGLGTFFETSAAFWYAREFHYRETLNRLGEKDDTD